MNDEESLVRELVRSGYLKTSALVDALRKIDRRDFVPQELAHEAYENYPLPIGRGQTISQPLTVAFMLEELAPQPGEKILEIGAGSGWQTALLAYLVGEKGRVVAVERLPELVRMAERNVGKYNFVVKGVVRIVEGDGSKGFKEEAPFDRIIAAASGTEIPPAWKVELKVGGRLVAPVGQSIVVMDKIGAKEFKTKEHSGFVFVPLVSDH